jgi:tetratricopeptide (TPR) repeat protein
MAPLEGHALDQARAAAKAGDYAHALNRYEHFFDHALDDDPYSSYGVRLSYCLNEWAKLGEKYPQAIRQLEQKANTALDLLNKTRNPERFHDLVAICKYLGRKDEPIRQFLSYHSSDRDLAASIVRFIWDQLVKEKHWEICADYLPEPKTNYDTALAKFDQAMHICKEDPSLGGNEFEEQIKGWYVRDLTNLLLVLRYSSKNDDAAIVLESMTTDMESRNYPELIALVRENVAV